MILLIGMKSSLMTYPIAPITPKPIAHDDAIFRNSKLILIVTLPIRLFASDDKHFTLLSELLDILNVLLDFGAHLLQRIIKYMRERV
jgi:hypothetical protein